MQNPAEPDSPPPQPPGRRPFFSRWRSWSSPSVPESEEDWKKTRKRRLVLRLTQQTWRWLIGVLFPIVLAGFQVWACYALSRQTLPVSPFPWSEFFRHCFITSLVLHALLLAFSCYSFPKTSYLRPTLGAISLAAAVSFLLAADARPGTSLAATGMPESFSSLLYILLSERQALLGLAVLTVLGVVIGTYYVLRSLFVVEYTGSGIQIKLPGQTVYYLPIYSQISWQNTEIVLKKGERVSIELSGQVSPGELQNIEELRKHMESFHEWQDAGARPEEWAKVHQAPTWPYTSPAGYKEEWYGGDTKLEILKINPIYKKKDFFYRDDTLLTVQGLPHNRVLGIIRGFGEPRPRDARRGQRAYKWQHWRDGQDLLYLSSDHYPILIEANKTGCLWVVINDVDEARWDNRGMFFLKLTKHSWL